MESQFDAVGGILRCNGEHIGMGAAFYRMLEHFGLGLKVDATPFVLHVKTIRFVERKANFLGGVGLQSKTEIAVAVRGCRYFRQGYGAVYESVELVRAFSRVFEEVVGLFEGAGAFGAGYFHGSYESFFGVSIGSFLA